jgi:hypothetical protein
MILVFYAKGELDDDETAELVGYVDQLDEHLTAGSEIPLEWRPVVTRRTVDLPPL